MSHRIPGNTLAAALCVFSLVGCGSDNDRADDLVPAPGPTYSIGGSVTGSTGSLTLQNSNGATLTVAAAGAFTFAAEMPAGSTYNVSVPIPPTGQTCAVTNGTGSLLSADVTNIAVNCTAAAYTLGGTVSGLGAGKTVVLQVDTDGGSSNLPVSANGAYAFTPHFNAGAEYEVFVLTQPASQTCTVANDAGEVGEANVTNVAVTCVNNSASSRNWQTASNISTDADITDTNGLYDPRVAHDAAGNALAVWSADVVGGAGRNIMWSRRPAGGAWTTPAKIPDWIPPVTPMDGEFRRYPVVSVAANGNAIAAWRVSSYQGDHVMASTFTPATGWTVPVFLFRKHPDMPSGAVDLRIATDAANNTLVVWAANGLIYYNRHTPGTGWVETAAVEGFGRIVSDLGTGPADEPEMALNAAGQAVAIWRQGRTIPMNLPHDFDLFSSRYEMSTDTWTTPVQLEDGSGDRFFGKSLVIDATGTATALWSDYDGSITAIRASRLVSNVWAPPSLVASGDSSLTEFAMFPQAVIDGSGNIMAAWQQGDIDNAHFVATRYVPGTVWGGSQVIGQSTGSSSPIFSNEFTLAGNAAGHVVILWSVSSCLLAENVACPVDVYANEYNPANGQWGAEEVIDKESDVPGEVFGDASTVQAAVDASGNAIAIWDQDNGPGDGIRYALFE